MEIEGVTLALPSFVTELRLHQEQAISEIVAAFEDRDVIFLDAPTGAGKTIIGEAVRQVMRSNSSIRQALYLCTTKSLQAQVLHDFPYAKLIKGRSNYPTLDNPEAFKAHGERRIDASHCSKKGALAIDVPICEGCVVSDPDARMGGFSNHEIEEEKILHCHFCHPWQYCYYEVAKHDALSAQLAVANTAYLLTEANMVGRFGADADGNPAFPLFIIDEADSLESTLMSFVEVSIPPRYIKEYGLGIPEKVTKPESWLAWSDGAVKTVGDLLASASEEAARYDEVNDPLPITLKRDLERLDKHLGTLKYANRSLRIEPGNWVLDDYQRGGVTLKPITVSSHVQDLLWQHGTKFLLMSATMISPHQEAMNLGLPEEAWASVIVDSNFPPERRPIHVRSRANMTNKTKEEEWPKMITAVSEVLDSHPGERVLIHTVSYPWTEALMAGLKSTKHGPRLLSYRNAFERESTLETYKHRPDAVLLAPSFDRGIDLPDDLCRVIVITKVPYPNLGDQQVNKRFFATGAAGKGWYYTQTVRSIVQMTGRGMRHREDHCITYILDAQFRSNLWSNAIGRKRLPRWWTDALIWEAPRRNTP